MTLVRGLTDGLIVIVFCCPIVAVVLVATTACSNVAAPAAK